MFLKRHLSAKESVTRILSYPFIFLESEKCYKVWQKGLIFWMKKISCIDQQFLLR